MTQQLRSTSSERPCEHPGAREDMDFLLAHLDAAHNLARWLMHDEADAEDMVQEAYLRAITNFAGFRGGDGRAWLLKIVRNSCYDRLRRRRVSGRNTDFDEHVHSDGRQAPNPETALLLAERNELVKKSLAELPAEYRELLILRELEQMPYREIANIVELPLGTVTSRISRARQRLQRILVGCWNERAVDMIAGANMSAGRVALEVAAQ